MKIKYLALLLFCYSAQAKDIIKVVYDEQNRSLIVDQCFDSAPRSLSVNPSNSYFSDLKWIGTNQEYSLPMSYGRVRLPSGENGCFHYKASFKNNTRTTNQQFKRAFPNSLLVSIDDWLFSTYNHFRYRLPEVHIHHSSEIQISAPWKLLARSDKLTKYKLNPTPRYSDGFVAFSPLNIKEIKIPGTTLRLAIMAGTKSSKSDLIEDWIKTMANAIASVTGKFPIEDLQVLVILLNSNGGPVPWGQVNRAGGSGVLFVVNSNSSNKRLYDDWTAAHEFSHLLTPYTPNDRWLSEGFASYHQNISRLKSGLLDEKTAWSKLIAGFERGRRSATRFGAPLIKNSNHKFNMQMYWSGAVIALKADIELQLKTNGKMNLSKALSGLKDCCLSSNRAWTASQLFDELDRISQTNVFSQLYSNVVSKKAFPEYKPLLGKLGVYKKINGQVQLNDDSPYAKLRKNISLAN